jgi:hypothetical protein
MKEIGMKNATTSSTMTTLQFAAVLLGAVAVVLAPATAHAQPVGGGGGGGCHYTDKDGYDIPIDDGQSVIVDGKTVTCSGGTITVSAPPRNTGGTRPNVGPGRYIPGAKVQ